MNLKLDSYFNSPGGDFFQKSNNNINNNQNNKLKKSLPFPLPDPYSDSNQFELYDPRGLFNSGRRRASSSTTTTTTTTTSNSNSEENQNNLNTTSGGISNKLEINSSNEVDNNNKSNIGSSGSSRLSLLMSSVPSNSNEVINNSNNSSDIEMKDEENLNNPNWSDRIPIIPISTHQHHHPNLTPIKTTTYPTPKALDPFKRLRIGSFGSNSSIPITTSSSPKEISSPVLIPAATNNRRVVSESSTSSTSFNQQNDLDEINLTSMSQPWSPAMGFLASFSPPVPPAPFTNTSPNNNNSNNKNYFSNQNSNSISTSFGSTSNSLFNDTINPVNGGTQMKLKGDEEGFIIDGYKLGKSLGEGGFGIVREAIKISTTTTNSNNNTNSIRKEKVEEGEEKIAVKIVRHKPLPSLQPIPIEGLKRSISGIRMMNRRAASNGGGGPILNTGGGGFERSRSSSSSSPSTTTNQFYSNFDKRPITPPTSSTNENLNLLLKKEIQIWETLLPHPHIVPLLKVIHHQDITSSSSRQVIEGGEEEEEEKFTYIFMPLCEGGNLLTFLNERDGKEEERKGRGKKGRGRGRGRGRGTDKSGLRNPLEDETVPAVVEEEEEEVEEEEEEEEDISSTERKKNSTNLLPSPTKRIKHYHPSPLSPSSPTPLHSGLPLSTILPIFAQIVSGLHYLHTEAKIVHKDIKLENILCDSKRIDLISGERLGTWRIADFGLAELGGTTSTSTTNSTINLTEDLITTANGGISLPSNFLPSTPLSSLSRATSLSSKPTSTSSSTPSPPSPPIEHLYPAGSLPYSSPEQMKSSLPILNPSVDIWALGCILFALLEGRLPIEDEFEPRLRMRIMEGDWKIPNRLLILNERGGAREGGEEEEELVKKVLEGCLEKNVEKRWTIEKIKTCDWLLSDLGNRGRGRKSSRSRSKNPSTSLQRITTTTTSNNNSPCLTPTTTTTTTTGSNNSSRSTSRVGRRKERSSSRGNPIHYLDPETKSLERYQNQLENKKSRWTGGLINDSTGGERGRGNSRSASRGNGGENERMGRVGEPY